LDSINTYLKNLLSPMDVLHRLDGGKADQRRARPELIDGDGGVPEYSINILYIYQSEEPRTGMCAVA
jgi:hypothetical protein